MAINPTRRGEDDERNWRVLGKSFRRISNCLRKVYNGTNIKLSLPHWKINLIQSTERVTITIIIPYHIMLTAFVRFKPQSKRKWMFRSGKMLQFERVAKRVTKMTFRSEIVFENSSSWSFRSFYWFGASIDEKNLAWFV